MAILKPIGKKSSSTKYDILACIAAHCLSADKTTQRQTLRLIALITARYNWLGNELKIGQKEIARLWAVDTRTVKREVARLKLKGWLEVRHQGARGRVTTYKLNIEKIISSCQPQLSNIGPDFVQRLGAVVEQKEQSKVVNVDFGQTAAKPVPVREGSWGDVMAAMRQVNPTQFESWLARLDFVNVDAHILTLRAPSTFVANYVQSHLSDMVLNTAKRAFTDVRRLRIVG